MQPIDADVNISIHAPLTGCDAVVDGIVFDSRKISIHAPLTGCDWVIALLPTRAENFNPRTPYGMRRKEAVEPVPQTKFQSTHPLRDATYL